MEQRKLALDILYKTIKDESYSNLLMRKELEKIEPIKRAFVTNIVNGVLRKYEILNFQFESEIENNTSLKLRLILCMALYERFYMKEKDYVVNNEYVNLCENKYDKAFVNALLHKITTFKESDEEHVNACLPIWIYRLLQSQYNKQELKNIINIYQSIPSVYYRINKTKCSYDDLKKLNISILNDDIFTCKENLIKSSLYENGYFYIQDYNSASLYLNLDLLPECSLLDICSAPGSKLFNCLDIVKPNNCYANDINSNRVNLIKKMANKLGFDGINYINVDGTQISEHLNMSFDRIMLDAPCSGLGVISRKPDLKFHITPESLDELQIIQKKLLDEAIKVLNIEGILLYSTCTLNKKENARQIDEFIKNNTNIKLIKEDTIINEMGDCFYYAKMKKVA